MLHDLIIFLLKRLCDFILINFITDVVSELNNFVNSEWIYKIISRNLRMLSM